MKNIFNVLIIGAGQIGAFYDNPNSKSILTHAHAFSKHPNFNLVGFADIDLNKAVKASSIWGGKSFSNLKNAFETEKIDILCNAVSDEYHFSVLKEALKYPIKFIITEKPLTMSLEDAKKIIKLYKLKRIPILVNYSRRFTVEFQELKKQIQNRKFGNFITGAGYYGKGVIHNGSHMIDLLRLLIGEITQIKVQKKIYDFNKNDPTISALLGFNRKSIFFMQGVDSRLFAIFEIDLTFEKARIRITNSGFNIEIYQKDKSKHFNNYFNLNLTDEIKTSLGQSPYNMANNVYKHLINGEALLSPASEAYKTLKTCQKIINS